MREREGKRESEALIRERETGRSERQRYGNREDWEESARDETEDRRQRKRGARKSEEERKEGKIKRMRKKEKGESEKGGKIERERHVHFCVSCMSPCSAWRLAARELLARVDALGKIDGVSKLRRKVVAEEEFLVGRLKQGSLCQSQLLGTNLTSLAAVVDLAHAQPQLCAVDRKFSMQYRGEEVLHVVDVVADEGQSWFKVSARNTHGLHVVWTGAGDFGKKSLVDHAQDILRLARANPCHFAAPTVHYLFVAGVPACIKEHLQSLGVAVLGDVVACPMAPARCIGFDFCDESGGSDTEPDDDDAMDKLRANAAADPSVQLPPALVEVRAPSSFCTMKLYCAAMTGGRVRG